VIQNQGHSQEFTKGKGTKQRVWGTEGQGQNIEILENTNGAVKKLTYGDRVDMHLSPLWLRPCPKLISSIYYTYFVIANMDIYSSVF